MNGRSADGHQRNDKGIKRPTGGDDIEQHKKTRNQMIARIMTAASVA